jgi:S1-C subfamily serine protease
VYITSITEDVAAQYGLPQAGVLIQQIIQGGSAYNSGLQAGDIITAYNGNAVFTTDQLMSAVKASKVGDTVKITVVRDGQTKTIDVKLLKGSSSF